MIFSNARSCIVVPGYGMAVAQAQHAVRELGDLLRERDISVKFAIHPVAGRMPGHMNVLLAEADIPYENLVEMDEINPEFPQTDVALVIGANDVVNPDARTAKGSPIYGMPILDVDRARYVFVLKRSMNPGFAGVANPQAASARRRSGDFSTIRQQVRQVGTQVPIFTGTSCRRRLPWLGTRGRTQVPPYGQSSLRVVGADLARIIHDPG